jgi:glutamate racemase
MQLAPWPVDWIDPAPAIARRTSELIGPASGGAAYRPKMLFTSGRAAPPDPVLAPFFRRRAAA